MTYHVNITVNRSSVQCLICPGGGGGEREKTDSVAVLAPLLPNSLPARADGGTPQAACFERLSCPLRGTSGGAIQESMATP